MVSSSVKTMSFLSNQTVSTRSETLTDNKTSEFAKMMDNSINKAKDVNVKSEVKQENKTEEDYKVEKDSETEASKLKESETKDNVSDNGEVSKVDEVVETEEMPEEMPEEVSQEILGVVAAILNVSVEELKNNLEQMNIDVSDLQNVSDVTKLVMDMNNISNKMELLVNEDASEAIKDIQKAVEEVLKNADNKENVNPAGTEFGSGLQAKVAENSKEFVEVKDDNATDAKAEIAENVTANAANETLQETTGDADGNEEGAANQESDEKGIVDNPLNDLKNNILNEIEVALDERVDESISTRIINQITENITVAMRESMTSLEMQLYPEHLGKVTVVLATEEGGITAKITAETEMAKNAIEQQLTILKDNFEKQGLKVTDIEVTIASHGFEQNLDKNNEGNENQSKRGNGIRKSLLDEIDGVSEAEETENIVMQTLGNTVSYLA